MNQFFIQDGARIDIPTPTWEGLPESSEINAELCDVLFSVFDDYDRYNEVGGWAAMEDAFSLEYVLVMSIWADHYSEMLWLDGLYPVDGDAATPGHLRGDCPAEGGSPDEVIANHPDA